MSEDPKFGELKEVPMRDIWAHEARKFTSWLERNIGALGNALDLDLFPSKLQRKWAIFRWTCSPQPGTAILSPLKTNFTGLIIHI